MLDSRRSAGRILDLRILVLGILVLGGAGLLTSCVKPSGGGGGPALERGTFYVSIEETLEGQATDPNIAELLVVRRLIQHGFQQASSEADARFVITGKVTCTYLQETRFEFEGQGVTLEHQFEGQLDCKLVDKKTPAPSGSEDRFRTERFSFPEPLVNGRNRIEDAERDIRRRVATILSSNIAGGEILGRPEIKGLIDALGDQYETRTFNQILEKLVEHRVDAIPYLLETLSDERPVRLSGEYPGLEDWNKDSLRYYHIADKGLEEIFQQFSGMNLEAGEDELIAIQLAWTWAWEDLQRIPEEFRTKPNARENTVKAPRPGEPFPGLEADEGEPVILQEPIEAPSGVVPDAGATTQPGSGGR